MGLVHLSVTRGFPVFAIARYFIRVQCVLASLGAADRNGTVISHRKDFFFFFLTQHGVSVSSHHPLLILTSLPLYSGSHVGQDWRTAKNKT